MACGLSLHRLDRNPEADPETGLREALAWEREQMDKLGSNLHMTFQSFVSLYSEDMKSRLKENTWCTKENIINTKILPYFGKRKINQIVPKDIIAWQN